MTEESIMFISSNVGSMKSQKSSIFATWSNTIQNHILKQSSPIVILSMQEFGGKNVPTMETANAFFQHWYQLLKHIYPILVCYYDSEGDNKENFTALCTLFLAKESISKLELLDFNKNVFESFTNGYHLVVARSSNTNNSETIQSCIKEKFPIHLFPNRIWSRKGYIINRLRISGTQVIDIINLHLIHDSNFFYIVDNPCVFQNYRKNQLEHIIKELDLIDSKSAVLCGDFNFRTSIVDLLQNFSKQFIVERNGRNNTDFILTERDSSDRNNLVYVSSKELRLSQSLLPLDNESIEKHKKSDIELDRCDSSLFELPIHFEPTYCYSVDSNASTYNVSRCPSWCDRIIFRGEIASKLKEIMENDGNNQDGIKYELIGKGVMIGDHKPVSVILPMKIAKD